RDELIHAIGFIQHLIRLVVREFERMPRRAAVVMWRPTLDWSSGEISPLFEETPSPIEVVAVRPRGDQVKRHTVTGEPFGEFPIFTAIIFGRELAAAAPALVANPPVTHREWSFRTIGDALVGQCGLPGWGIAVFHPLLK